MDNLFLCHGLRHAPTTSLSCGHRRGQAFIDGFGFEYRFGAFGDGAFLERGTDGGDACGGPAWQVLYALYDIERNGDEAVESEEEAPCANTD